MILESSKNKEGSFATFRELQGSKERLFSNIPLKQEAEIKTQVKNIHLLYTQFTVRTTELIYTSWIKITFIPR